MVCKEFAAVGFELVLQPAQIARQYVRRQGLAGVLERIADHAEGRHDLRVDVFQCAHHFVAEQGLKLVFGVKPGELSGIARDCVALGDLYVIDVKRRHLIQRCGLAHLGKITERKAVVLEWNSADVQGQPCGLGASAGKVEIGKLEFVHGFVSCQRAALWVGESCDRARARRVLQDTRIGQAAGACKGNGRPISSALRTVRAPIGV